MNSIDNFKRSVKRVVTRLVLIVMVIVFGLMAIAQAQRDQLTQATVNGAAPPHSSIMAALSAPDAQPETSSGPSGYTAIPDAGRLDDHAAAQLVGADVSGLPPIASAPVYHDSQFIPVSVEEAEDESRFDVALADAEAPIETARRNPFRGEGETPPLGLQPTDDLLPPPLETGNDAGIADQDRFPVSAEAFPNETASPAPNGRYEDDGGTSRYQDNFGPVTEQFAEGDGLVPFGNGSPATASAGAADRAGRFRGLDDGPVTPPGLLDEPPKLQQQPPVAAYEQDAVAAPIGQGESPFSGYAEVDAFGASQPPAAATTSIREATPERLPPAAGVEEFQPSTRGRNLGPHVASSGTGQTGTGTPGPTQLEGPQTPTLTIQKIAPPRMAVGQLSTFQIKVRNIGRTIAENVLIRDEIPQGAELIDSNPRAQPTSDGAIMWPIGTLGPGDESTVSIDLKPSVEGEIGSVATVSFQTGSSARVQVTRPMLEIVHVAPQTVLVGEPVRFKITLSNPGTGEASAVVLEEDVPSGLAHSSGQQLEYEVGNIPPGGTRQLELTLTAAEPGNVENVIVARGEGGLFAEHRIQMQVVAPKLSVRIEGPRQRYLERQATFTLAIENPGTAPAQNVELSARLPNGLKFVNANNSGHYDSSTQTIRWSLAKLNAGQYGKVQFTAVPMEMGSFPINAATKADKGLADTKEHLLQVEGIAALLFTLEDKLDPIELGGETVYEIRVRNQGSKSANGVRFTAMIPDGMKPVRATGPTNYEIQGNRVVFNEIAQLSPKQESQFQIQVQGTAVGDQRFRVAMTSTEMTQPVIKEESTKVYSDR